SRRQLSLPCSGSPSARRSRLCPYTTLFRSHGQRLAGMEEITHHAGDVGDHRVSGVEAVDDAHLALRDGPEQVRTPGRRGIRACRSEEHTSELQSRFELVCRLLLDTKTVQTR